METTTTTTLEARIMNVLKTAAPVLEKEAIDFLASRHRMSPSQILEILVSKSHDGLTEQFHQLLDAGTEATVRFTLREWGYN